MCPHSLTGVAAFSGERYFRESNVRARERQRDGGKAQGLRDRDGERRSTTTQTTHGPGTENKQGVVGGTGGWNEAREMPPRIPSHLDWLEGLKLTKYTSR